MKKVFALILALAIFSTASFAQAPKTQPKKEKKEAAVPKTTHVKKDGTADMRYKENKAKKEAAGPKKKDGTPDMRYKANKPATKKNG
ncbi:hypothetical protein [Hydrotalea sp.]|uniref:hypothetical protein n=1 Tax=Hydrotalea sp. TaxID=2881279 RepID=UPI0026328E08|nr:hypothetical protein [Hydrotalea sp.]